MLAPASIEELQEIVRGHARVLAVGGGTKGRLWAAEDCQLVSTRGLTGMTDYVPSEYTFTALAGTPVREVHEALCSKGQFLPCSALLREAGATLGGAVASGLSGAGRLRFGGLRDFVLGIRFVSGEGSLVAAGGRVVKNAAGFDLPKFMVGSLGRYGILTEITFKVFPAPSASRTLCVECASHEEAAGRIAQSAAARWELSAIDYDPMHRMLYLRLEAPASAVPSIAAEILRQWPGDARQLGDQESGAIWRSVRELGWVADAAAVAKVPLTLKALPVLQRALEAGGQQRAHYSAAGNVAFIALPDTASVAALSGILLKQKLCGLTFIGGREVPMWLGLPQSQEIAAALAKALDPQRRFPPMTSQDYETRD